MKDIESAILRLHTTKPSNSIWDLPPPPTTQVPEPEPTEPTSDPTPYKTALPSGPTTPTESSAVDDQVIEEWPALPKVSFAISSLYYITEFQRGLAGIGNFQLKTELLHARRTKSVFQNM